MTSSKQLSQREILERNMKSGLTLSIVRRDARHIQDVYAVFNLVVLYGIDHRTSTKQLSLREPIEK